MTEPKRGEYYAGLLPDELADLQKLAALLHGCGAALPSMVSALEAVLEAGYGEVTVTVTGGKPVLVKTMVTKSLK